MLVSIIINTVDRPEDLSRCLDACFGQTYRDFEIVVVNNGFGEESLKVLQGAREKAEALRIPFKIIEDKTKKLSYLFNVGWKSADPSAGIFAYCADDTEPARGWLQAIVNHLRTSPDAGAVSGPTISTTQPPGEMFNLYAKMCQHWWSRIILRVYEYFVLEDKTFEPGRWCQSGAFTMGAGIDLPQITEPVEIELLTSGNIGVRREAMEQVQGFDENFYFNHADGDLFIRMGKAGYKMMFDPAVRVLHHMRFGPTRHPEIMGRDTAFYYLKDVRPQSWRGWVGWALNLGVFWGYWLYRAVQDKSLKTVYKGWSGFVRGIYDFFSTNTSERNELLSGGMVVVSFLVLMAIVHRNLGAMWGMLAYGDAMPWPGNARTAFDTFFSAWSPVSPGIVLPQIPVLSSLTFFEGVLIALCGGNAVLAQWLFHFAPFPLAFITCYYALGYLFRVLNPPPRPKTLVQKIYRPSSVNRVYVRAAKFIAAFAYTFNLVAIGEMTGGFEGNLYVQATMPLLLVFMAEIAQNHQVLKNWCLLTGAFAVSYLLSDHLILYLVPLVPLFILWSTLTKAAEGKGFSFFVFVRQFIVKGLLYSSAFAAALPLTWFYSCYYLQTALPFLAGGEALRPEVMEFLIRNVNDTYRFWFASFTLRQGGGGYLKLFRGGLWWARTGFVLPLLAITPWLFAKNWYKRRIWVLLVSTGLAALAIWFVDYTRAYEAIPVHRAVPVLFRFRNPSRLNLFVALAYVPLIFLGLESLLERIFTNTRGRFEFFKIPLFLFFIFSLLSLSFYYRPAFSGDYTLGYNRGSGAVVAPFYYRLGEYLRSKHGREGFFRTMYLPWDHENAEVKMFWIDPYAYGVPINYGAYGQSEYLEGMKQQYQQLAKEVDLSLGKRLARSGVRYLVVLKKGSEGLEPAFYRYDYQTPWLLGPWNQYRRIMEAQSDIELIEETDDYLVYQNLSFDTGLLDPLWAGEKPNNLTDLQEEKNKTLWVSLISWGLLLSLATYSFSRAALSAPKIFRENYVWAE